MTRAQIRAEFRRIQRDLDRLMRLVLADREMGPGPEHSREEVSPMGTSLQRDCCTARLAAA